MERNVLITADSTCDLPAELKKKYNISTYPLHIILGRTSYDDGVNITPDEIYKHFKTSGTLPKTSAVNVQEYIDGFLPLVEQGYEIVHINLGSALSASYKNCCIAAEQLGNVYPVDSCNLSSASGLLALEAAEMAEKGMSGKEIAENIRALTLKTYGSFVVDRLDYLRAGGRCSTIAMLGANLLSLKPSIIVNNTDGSMTVGKKYRGKLEKVLPQYIDDKLAEFDNINPKRVFITHSGISDERLKLVYDYLKSKNVFNEILISRAGCTISSHCGPNTLGILFMTK